MNRPRLVPCTRAVLTVLTLVGVARAAVLLPPGYRPEPNGVHALVGGDVVIRPGEVVPGGTVVIRDGFIQAAGKDVVPPVDARILDLHGATIYAGFIEPYLVSNSTNAPVATDQTEPEGDEQTALTASGIKFFGTSGARTDMGTAGPGSEVVKVTPDRRAVRDYSPNDKTLDPLRALGFTAAVISPGRGILRGTSALVTLADADPNVTVLKPDVFQHVAFETQRPRETTYPGSLMGVIATVRQSFCDAAWYAGDQADYREHPQGRPLPQFNPAWEALQPAAAARQTVLFEPGSALMDNRAARIAGEFKLDFVLVACGQEWRRPDLIKADGGRFIVPLEFPTLPKLPNEEDWDQVPLDTLRAWDWAAENPALLRQHGSEVALTTYGLKEKKSFRSNLRLALDRGLSETDAVAALTTVPAKFCGAERLLGTIEPGKLANLTVVTGGSYFSPEAEVRELWIQGKIYRLPGPTAKQGKAEKKPGAAAKPPEAKESSTAEENGKPGKKEEQLRAARKARVARSPLEGRGPIAEPPSVLIRNATIWTCGPQGRLDKADVLIAAGQVKAIGPDLAARAEPDPGRVVIEGAGLHVTPGLLDAHSHTAVMGGVNESTLPSSAMCRVSDVVNSDTENLYRQLAGGVTIVNLLHGSANPIGGQNWVIKLRDGAAPDDLTFQAARPGIKFALGENVKQSNWGEGNSTRFPQTRMGARTFLANRFTAAQEYLAGWEDFRQGRRAGKPVPRRDLELEALGEVIKGRRIIHCHAYRQDEILMFIRLAESFGIRIASFEHVLEGYKVADELARHGAAGSTFSDWWAYKFEVYDAISFNGSLMRDRGVRVAFNSDDSEVARHLYLEAAKAVKYGDTPEIEALKFVTINPASHLRLDRHVGSLEPGKDADFVVWSKAPLDSGTVCLQTWIDGKKYFDREENVTRVARLAKERQDLIAKAKRIAKDGTGSGGQEEKEEP